MLKSITRSSFFIRLFNWEFWPFYLANFPVVCIWLFFSVRARSLFFFSAANPEIETGGMLGESKMKILEAVPDKYKPVTLLMPENSSVELVESEMVRVGLEYPVIAKPDVGERGLMVKKVDNIEELTEYCNSCNFDFLIQEFVGAPMEVAVFHYRFPEEQTGTVCSVCIKDFLKVKGDGSSSIEELMDLEDRSRMQIPRLLKTMGPELKRVPLKDEVVLLEPIGNHSRGTTFLNGNEHIDQQLQDTFDKLSLEMGHILYCRHDIRCENLEELKEGNFKVLEVNGVASEPAHIYDPSYTIWKAYRDFYRQWRIIYRIAKAQRKRGIPYMTFAEAREYVGKYRAHLRKVKRGKRQ